MTASKDLRVDNRKDFLLLLLAAPGRTRTAEPIIGVTRLQKYLFLLQEQFEWHKKFAIKDPYVFEAYDYGPFDSQIYDDLQLLENAGFVTRENAGVEPIAENDEARRQALDWATVDEELAPWEEETQVHRFALTEKGEAFVARYQVPNSDIEIVAELKREWNGKPLQSLLRWLYTTYPRWAKNTKLVDLRPQE